MSGCHCQMSTCTDTRFGRLFDCLIVFACPLGNGPQLLRDGDLRVVLDASGANRSISHNIGFNLAAKHFRFNQRLYSLGGRGFWNAHAKLVEFIEKTGEWELVMMEGGRIVPR